MELNSCGSVRNNFAVPSTSVWAAGCKSAAATNCRGCRCRPGYHVASAAADRKNPRCSKSVDCRKPVCFRMRAGAARKNGRCWKRLVGCRCSLALKALRPARWRLQTANRRVPTADDSHCSCPLFARVGSRDDWKFRNPQAHGHYQLHFPALPKCVGYCPRAATQCCPS